jgi:signal transduction histidine kinase
MPMDALLASFFMQSALAAVFLVALWGIAFVYRRPLHRALATGWSIYLVHTLASFASAWYGRASPLSSLRWHTATVQLLAVAGSAAYWYASVGILSGRQERSRPSARVTVWAMIVVVAMMTLSLASGRIMHQPGSGPLSILYPLLYIALAANAWWESRRATAYTRELFWMGVAFALFSTRMLLVTQVLLPEEQFAASTLTQLLAVATVQLLQMVAVGVISIGVAVTYERSAVLLLSERLHLAELSAKKSKRLESLGRMAASVAHDFNNVLMIIGSCADLAEDAMPNSDDVRRELRDIRLAATQGGGLVTRLLDFSQPATSDPAPAQHTRVDAVVQENAPLLEKAIGPERRLEVDMAAGDLPCVLDRTQLEQLLLNMVVNARDATPVGGVIRLRTGEERLLTPRRMHDGMLDAGRYIRVSVEDNGAGIAPDVLPHILEPFFTTKRERGGTGIGLATVHQIVVGVGGELAIASEVGVGTCIDLYLPVAA